jgi:hypothetical protein
LLLALGASAGALLFLREPSSERPATDSGDGRAAIAPEEVTRPALEAAIQDLVGWIERGPREPRTPLGANLRLLALGRAALPSGESAPRSLAWANLEALAGSNGPVAQVASRTEPSVRVEARDGDALATLAILLETGIPLDEELRFASGVTSVRKLLELALPSVSQRRADPDPWALDLLSFAVLGGMSERRAELGHLTLSSLTRLDRQQQPLTELQGDGAAAGGALEQLTTELGRRIATGEGRGADLQLSAAVFRAVAVLGEPALEQRALRHVNALLFRYQLERDVYQRLLARTPDPAQRVAVHVDAIESLGRLEQALYGAHVTFRRGDRPGPAPRTASSMRRAASDLIEHLSALGRGSSFDARAVTRDGPGQDALLRAATQALRGLRAARAATG